MKNPKGEKNYGERNFTMSIAITKVFSGFGWTHFPVGRDPLFIQVMSNR